jgi:hypothetical protein
MAILVFCMCSIRQYFWRSREPKTILSSEPSTIHDFWYGLPENVENIDAAFEHPTNRRIYFFSGKAQKINEITAFKATYVHKLSVVQDKGFKCMLKFWNCLFGKTQHSRCFFITKKYWQHNAIYLIIKGVSVERTSNDISTGKAAKSKVPCHIRRSTIGNGHKRQALLLRPRYKFW